ncbi:hypothetical protein Nepgr_012126 [Nepenthes gracilis]|uniref:PRLI-interacting factor A n=1 Tax=Nepenthes gracilis TaxID=150966 RepID=A0AAD3SGD9_NEPGR|nr:hypothetical protein Nepgr_012126 [Nepenthes gracilis]
MSDQSRLISRHQVTSHPQLMGQSQVLNQSQMLNESQLVNMPRMTSQPQMLNQLNKQQIMSQMNPSQMVSQAPMITQPPSMRNQSKMMSQNYGNWPNHPANLPPMNPMTFSNPMMQMYGAKKPRPSNWRKKAMDKRIDKRRKDMVAASGAGGGPGGAGYNPPTLHELEHQNRLRARRFYPRKKYNRMAPYAHAPRNTSSYIIRAKKSGGIASLVSPCPVTPAVLPTPVLSPSREALVEMAKEEWGVDGYGSMKGLIRLRSSPGHEEPGHEAEVYDYEEEEEGESSESDVEEHVEVERRLDHDLSRFEMIYPNSGVDYNNVLENQVDDQYTRIAQFEEENLLLKERLYLMERELGDLRRRLQFLERQSQVVEDINEDVIKNASENESEGLRDVHLGQSGNDEADHVSREEEAGQHEKRKWFR